MSEIKLTQGKVALVDDGDFESLSRFTWHAHNNSGKWYAMRRTSRRADYRSIGMHNEIMGALEIDHRNGNGLDNRKENLRLATRSQNIANSKLHRDNSSGIKGVYLDKATRKWRAQIGFNYRVIQLGRFVDKEQAIRARRGAQQAMFGEFAR
jgi:hypothetical protein